MAQTRLCITPAKASLEKVVPSLLPFHIDYTGPADVSTFMRIEPYVPLLPTAEGPSAATASSTNGIQEEAGNGTNGTLTRETTVSDVTMADGTSESQSDLNTTSTATTATTSASQNTLVATPTEASVELASLSITSSSSTIAATPSTSAVVEESQFAVTSTTLTSSSPSTSPTPSPLPQPNDSKNRVVSAFRGRTIHGLEIALPAGYSGVILRSDSKTSAGDPEKASTSTAKGKAKEIPEAGASSTGRASRSKSAKAEPKPKAGGGGKKPPRGRLTRSAAPRKGQVFTVDEGEQEDQDEQRMKEDEDKDQDVVADEDVDMSPKAEDESQLAATATDDNDHESPLRELVPSAIFDSIMLWQPDRPVDTGRDEYFRSLHEWVALANEIHRTDL